jgi:uncharacterized protein
MKYKEKGIEILIKVVPKSSKSTIVGWEAGRLKVKVQAPPDKGKANSEVIKLLAKALKVPQRDISILRGLHSRLKTLWVIGLEGESLDNILA